MAANSMWFDEITSLFFIVSKGATCWCCWFTLFPYSDFLPPSAPVHTNTNQITIIIISLSPILINFYSSSRHLLCLRIDMACTIVNVPDPRTFCWESVASDLICYSQFEWVFELFLELLTMVFFGKFLHEVNC